MKSTIKLATILIMVFAITLAFTGVSYFAGVNIASAEEGPVVYTSVDNDGNVMTITIIDETTCSATYLDSVATLQYEIKDGVITLTNTEKGTSIKFDIGADNKLTPHEDTPKVEEKSVNEDEVSEKVSEKISEYLSSFLQESLVVKIISWLIDIGAIGALVGIYFKYRKYKNTTLGDIEKLAEEKIESAIKEKFSDLQGDVTKQLSVELKNLKTVDDKINVLLQAFALSQDKTSEGKIAMLNLLQGKVEDQAVEEKIVEIKEDIVDAVEKVEEIVEKVEGEYTEIF